MIIYDKNLIRALLASFFIPSFLLCKDGRPYGSKLTALSQPLFLLHAYLLCEFSSVLASPVRAVINRQASAITLKGSHAQSKISGHAFWEHDRNFLSTKAVRERLMQDNLPFLLIFQLYNGNIIAYGWPRFTTEPATHFSSGGRKSQAA